MRKSESGMHAKLQSPRVTAIRTISAIRKGTISLLPGQRILYAESYAVSPDRCVVKSERPLALGPKFYLRIFNKEKKSWDDYLGTLLTTYTDQEKNDYHYARLSLAPFDVTTENIEGVIDSPKSGPAPSDYEFFLTVPFLKAIDRDAVCPLLNSLRYRRVTAGTRFIAQGDEGDSCYIVQNGRCQVLIEKNEAEYVISRIGAREFVGEMALLTGDHRSAHVVAESEMQLWGIRRDQFHSLVEAFPKVSSFLTEIMAERFATRKLTADRTIGKYRITDILGRGGYSIVYKGYHMDLNRPVAVKMLNHDMALNPEFSANFRQEAQTIASLNNENIIKIYDIEERYRTIFIIMELLDGMTLRQIIENTGPISEKETVKILLNICNGLQYAHAKGLVHQDIKPGNIFILPDGGVKILDFGLACPCGTETFLSGTPYYMSPEQVECLPVDERADLYALGVTAYEMLTGQRPFKEQDPFTVMNLHVNQAIPDPAHVKPEIHEVLRQFIRRSCARQPDRRYPSISTAIDALEPLAYQFGLQFNHSSQTKRKMSTMFLFYRDDQQLFLNKLMEAFSEKLKKEGIIFKATDFDDL